MDEDKLSKKIEQGAVDAVDMQEYETPDGYSFKSPLPFLGVVLCQPPNIEKMEPYNEYEHFILNMTFNQPALAWMQSKTRARVFLMRPFSGRLLNSSAVNLCRSHSGT